MRARSDHGDRAMNEIILEFPLQSAFHTTARLTTGGICSVSGLSFDDAEDCKVCVTESLILLANKGFRRARVVFSGEAGLKIAVEGKIKGEADSRNQEDEISAALIQALAENVVMEKSENDIFKIVFEFGLGK